MNKKKGFTLAETLVALAIIGVVVGIMLPVVNNSRPNQEMVMLKKAYYLAGKSISEIVNDEVLYPETDNDSGLANTERVIYRGAPYQGPTKFCGLLAAKMNTTCNNNSFTTSDGMTWTVTNGSFGNLVPIGAPIGTATIRVNVNPSDAECLDTVQNCTKPNTFEFRVSRNGNMSINGYLGESYLTEKNTTKKANEFDVDRSVSLSLPHNTLSHPDAQAERYLGEELQLQLQPQ